MRQTITIVISLEFEEPTLCASDMEDQFYDSVNQVVEDFAPDDKRITISIEEI